MEAAYDAEEGAQAVTAVVAGTLLKPACRMLHMAQACVALGADLLLDTSDCC